jgi:hypothetical protein
VAADPGPGKRSESAGELAKGGLRKKKEQIVAALQGQRMRETHRFLVRQAMEHMALLVEQIKELDRQIESKIRAEGWQAPYRRRPHP